MVFVEKVQVLISYSTLVPPCCFVQDQDNIVLPVAYILNPYLLNTTEYSQLLMVFFFFGSLFFAYENFTVVNLTKMWT